MDGIHDMGGMHGFGPIEREVNEPAFHEPWEGRVLGIARTMKSPIPGGARFAIEKLDPAFYLASSYFEKWMQARVNALIESGVIDPSEFARKIEELGGVMRPEDVQRTREAPAVVQEDKEGDAGERRFQIGDRARARHVHPEGHTRLPRYIRGKVGEIVRIYGAQDFQDHRPMSDHAGPQSVYAVRFDSREIWGESAEPNSSVLLDMWEAYLELP